MDELDDEQHMPEGVESAVWQRLVQTRREKVESEQQVNWLLLFPRGRNIEYRLQIEYRIWLVHNVLGIFLSSDLSPLWVFCEVFEREKSCVHSK